LESEESSREMDLDETGQGASASMAGGLATQVGQIEAMQVEE
jgi:hypothetical protein